MADNESEQKPQQEALLDDEFSLQSQYPIQVVNSATDL